MKSSVWTLVGRMCPIQFRVLAIGMVFGLLMGFLWRTESSDLATGIGISSVVACSVGIWLGTHLSFWILRLWSRWLASLSARLEALKSRLPTMDESDHASGTTRFERSGPRSIARLLMAFSLVALIFLPITGLLALMSQGDGAFQHVDWNWMPIALVNLGLGLLGVAGQSLALWRLDRRVFRLEQHLESLVPTVPHALQRVHRWDQSVRQTRSTVERVMGVRGMSEMPAAA